MTGTGPALRRTATLVLAPALVLLGCAQEQAGDAGAMAEDTAAMPAAATTESLNIADVGLQTPESVLHDPAADVYLVSNINGNPGDKDGNGFISRVTPDGQVAALRWIDGQAEGVTLHAPKGMTLKGDTLFVTDIDAVRLFHRETGAPLGERAIEGATFLNDMATGPDGTVYFTDSGFRFTEQGIEQTGSAAVYRFGPDGRAEAIARGDELTNPNGIAADEQGLTVVSFGSNQIYRVDAGGNVSVTDSVPAGQLDGVVRLSDGSLLVASWEGSTVYHVMPGHVMTAVENVPSPADIGYDARRNRILIPIFMESRVEVRPMM